MAARAILHVDMDAFYAAVEVLQNPALIGKPVIVGGSAERGVVASCSYEARAFGIKSAMSSSQARRLCPQAIWISGNHGLYGEYSEKVHECFAEVTPLIEPIALDEAFLDVTGARRLLGDPVKIATDLRNRIREVTGLVCSVGVGPSKLIAKLASVAAKPPIPGKGERVLPPGARRGGEGVAVVVPSEQLTFLHSHPARALWGIGPQTMARLERYGVKTVADLASLSEDTLIRAVGNAHGRHLHLLSNGIDDRAVEADRGVKSIGHEETFGTDHSEVSVLSIEIVRMADAVSNRLRDSKRSAKTITLKLKFSDFRLITRSKSVPVPVTSGVTIASVAKALLNEADVVSLVRDQGVRLLGVSVSGLLELTDQSPGREVLTEPPLVDQLDLFADMTSLDNKPHDRPPSTAVNTVDLDRAVASVKERFGDAALAPAVLATSDGLRVKRRGDTQWGQSLPEPPTVLPNEPNNERI
jgi:DNA polymerase IV